MKPKLIWAGTVLSQSAKEQIRSRLTNRRPLLDALVPAVVALEALHRALLPEALNKAAEAARIGAESTTGMLPRVGRAKTLGERARGGQDPGANSIRFLFAGLASNVEISIPEVN